MTRFRKIRKFEGIDKSVCDVLIIDSAGSEWIEYCLPKKCKKYTLEIRKSVPFIRSFLFAYRLFKCSVKSGLTSLSLLSAVILELKPKVIISFTDNAHVVGGLQTVFPDILVISVQNGVRLMHEPIYQPREQYLNFPNYFGFGDHEFNLMKSSGSQIKSYHSVGSLRMGIFLNGFYKENQSAQKNISFISQYTDEHARIDNKIGVKLTFLYRKICTFLYQFSQESGIKINILLRNEVNSARYQNELDFYTSIFGHDQALYFPNNKKIMSSYQKGIDSSLVIAFDSTLMFELLGVGVKILCFGIVDKELSNMRGNQKQCELLPHDLLLNSLNYKDFSANIYSLLSMNASEFDRKIKNSKKNYMNMQSKYPHQIIYKLIQSKINQSS